MLRMKQTKAQHAWRDSEYGRGFAWLALIAALVFSAVVRIRLLGMPFERDEGEFAYMGQLMLQGVPPYVSAYNMKLPGVYAAYAIIMALFGQSVTGVHIGLLLVSFATILLIFALARRLFGIVAAAAAALAFSLLSTSESVLGLAAHATHFVMLGAVGGFLQLLRAIEKPRPLSFFWSGLLLGLAVLMKQPGAFFVLFGLLYLAWATLKDGLGWKQTVARSAIFLAGAAAPLVITCAILLAYGAFLEFYRQTVVLARENSLTISQGVIQLREMLSPVFLPGLLLWILSGFGLASLVWNKRARAHWVFLLGFLGASCAAVTASYYFRNHYFIMLLPAAAIFVGVFVDSLGDVFSAPKLRTTSRLVAACLVIAAVAITINNQWNVLFQMTPYQACRATYGGNPFPESIEIADYIARHTKPNDKIAVMGSEAQIYFYAHRRAATGYIYTYLLMQDDPLALEMQHEMIREIVQARPKYIVFVRVITSWLPQPHSHLDIFKWLNNYERKYYNLVGVADIVPPDETEFYWGDEVESLDSASPNVIFIFRRKGT